MLVLAVTETLLVEFLPADLLRLKSRKVFVQKKPCVQKYMCAISGLNEKVCLAAVSHTLGV